MKSFREYLEEAVDYDDPAPMGEVTHMSGGKMKAKLTTGKFKGKAVHWYDSLNDTHNVKHPKLLSLRVGDSVPLAVTNSGYYAVDHKKLK